jgi:hypothetical protein
MPSQKLLNLPIGSQAILKPHQNREISICRLLDIPVVISAIVSTGMVLFLLLLSNTQAVSRPGIDNQHYLVL